MPEPRPSSSKPPGGLLPALFHPWTWRMAWRDSRTQRRNFLAFGFSMVSGIAALVAIHALKEKVGQGIEAEAKSLFAADVVVTSRSVLPPARRATLQAAAVDSATETTFATMMVFPGDQGARLVQARGFTGNFPFYGKVETAPPDGWESMMRGGGILLDPGLMRQYNLQPGAEVRIGRAAFRVVGEITKSLPRGGRFGGFAPEAYAREADLVATGLAGGRSLAEFRLNLRLQDGADASAFKRDWEKQRGGEGWRMETPEDRREALDKALDAFQRFLDIIALVALVLGALGVASAVQAHLARRVPSIAILRCLGCPPGAAYAVHLLQVLALGLCASLVGTAIGLGLEAGILAAFHSRLPLGIPPGVPWLVAGRAMLSGLALCLGFALVPLRRVREIAPALAIRGGGTFPDRSLRKAWPYLPLLVGLVFLPASSGGAGWRQALALTTGLCIAFAVLALTARLLMAVARRTPRPIWPYTLRQGIANLYRPRNQTLVFLLSLGLSSFLFLSTLLVHGLVLRRINLDGLADSPGLYLVDVQPDQADGVNKMLETHGLRSMEAAPMVTMRLAAVKGVPVAELLKRGTGPRWIYQHEFRSTWREYPGRTETMQAGEFNGTRGVAKDEVPVSLEQKMAGDLAVGIGDLLDIDVQGVALKARVTSLRAVDWGKFNLNFFMVFPPAALDGAPAFHVLTAKVPPGASAGPLQNALAKAYPNVTVIDLSLILKTIRDILDNIVMVVRVLSGFTLLSGAAILSGVFLNGRGQRVKESVLLRVLGATSRDVSRILLAEYAVLGTLSAATGILLAQLAGYLLAVLLFKVAPLWSPGGTLAVGAAALLFAVLAGLATGRGVCRHPPLVLLRDGAVNP